MKVVFIDADVDIIKVYGEILAVVTDMESLTNILPKDSVAYIDVRGFGMAVADKLVNHCNVIGITPRSPREIPGGKVWETKIFNLNERRARGRHAYESV